MTSSLFLLLFVPLVLGVGIAYRRRAVRFPLAGVPYHDGSRTRIVLRVSLTAGLALLIFGITAPAIPLPKTSRADVSTTCDRDILFALDVSGSMRESLDPAIAGMRAFARERPGDCFGIVIFNGPFEGEGGDVFAFLLNYGIRDADDLLLPLRTDALSQYAKGTRISEGLRVAREFFAEKSVSSSHVLILVSDLGNEERDHEQALEAARDLLLQGVRMYVFGVNVGSYNTFVPKFLSVLQAYGAPLLLIDEGAETDFAPAYNFVDAREAASAPNIRTHLEAVEAPVWGLYVASFSLVGILWILSRMQRRTV